MKKETKRHLFGALIPLSVYLSAAFITAEINFANWTTLARAMVVVVTVAFLFVYYGIILENQ